MTSKQASVPGKIQQRVVNRVGSGSRVNFVTAHHHVDSRLSCRLTQAIGNMAGSEHGSVKESFPDRYEFLQVGVPTLGPVGIPRQPDLGEYDQVGVIAGGLRDGLASALTGFNALSMSDTFRFSLSG